jgi:hypothetical protein
MTTIFAMPMIDWDDFFEALQSDLEEGHRTLLEKCTEALPKLKECQVKMSGLTDPVKYWDCKRCYDETLDFVGAGLQRSFDLGWLAFVLKYGMVPMVKPWKRRVFYLGPVAGVAP